ncbi:lipid-A-disaccharide kinase [Flavobacteriaceae bacterium MAR_2010_188]|nr:lipid-A-disaccharide kinase [Flavobacteriaceae bacterium MAR_2010_188]
MKFLRNILVPIVPFYWMATWVRNRLFDYGIMSSKEYSIPIICVGNLSTGGTGKTPMVEYLIELLQPTYKVAILSRGYRRKSEGFMLANNESRVEDLGDEPFQIHKKYPDILVTVDSDRRNGIKRLMEMENQPQVILLDDAYQHRKVKAGLNILLTTFQNPYFNDIVLPTGNLREPLSGSKRADLVVVTKSPAEISEEKMLQIKENLDLTDSQELYFSSIVYGDRLISSNSIMTIEELENQEFTLVTGIANPKPLERFLKKKNLKFDHLKFPDHHSFSKDEISDFNQKELILTTEKDFVRLGGLWENKKVFYIPIKIMILDKDADFDKKIIEFCQNYSIGAAEL